MKKPDWIIHNGDYVTSVILYGRPNTINNVRFLNTVFVKKLGGYIPKDCLVKIGNSNGRHYRLKKYKVVSMIPERNIVLLNCGYWVKADWLLPWCSDLIK